jgi:hypothetical protein
MILFKFDKISSAKTWAKRTEDVSSGWGAIKRKHISHYFQQTQNPLLR